MQTALFVMVALLAFSFSSSENQGNTGANWSPERGLRSFWTWLIGFAAIVMSFVSFFS